MPTRSGTQYHIPDLISEMDPNISSIANLLEDLSTRFRNVEQEFRNNRECLDRLECEITENISDNGPRSENRTSRYNIQPNQD